MIAFTLAPGTRIAQRYRITRLIAQGGMGAVHEAVDERLGREVALKTLRQELCEDAVLVSRFEREAQTAARLAHPCIAQVLDFGTSPEGLLYLVMERVRGETLAALLTREGRLAPMRAADIVEQTLGALASAHAAGVVHRDLKPGNIMIVPSGESREAVKLLDFGIAQLMDGAAYTRLTQTGVILGTPTYMSPEQALGSQVDARTDVYAMGVILWCLLTGTKPFSGPSMADVVEAILNTNAPLADAVATDVPSELARIADFAMQKVRERRFVDANAMGRALVTFRSREPASASIPEATASAPPEHAPPPALPSAWRSRRVLIAALVALVMVTSSCLALGLVGLGISAGWLARAAPGGGLAMPTTAHSEGCVRARRCCEAAAGEWGAGCASITDGNTTAEQCQTLLHGYQQSLRVSGRDASVCDGPSQAAPASVSPRPACAGAQRCCLAFLQRVDPEGTSTCDVYALPYIAEQSCVDSIAGYRNGLRSMSAPHPACE